MLSTYGTSELDLPDCSQGASCQQLLPARKACPVVLHMVLLLEMPFSGRVPAV